MTDIPRTIDPIDVPTDEAPDDPVFSIRQTGQFSIDAYDWRGPRVCLFVVSHPQAQPLTFGPFHDDPFWETDIADARDIVIRSYVQHIEARQSGTTGITHDAEALGVDIDRDDDGAA